MLPHSPAREEPDEDRDVIVHYIQTQDASAGEKRNTWTVWLGPKKQSECTTVEDAEAIGRKLARKHGRRAWLHDATGYPLKPIDL